jgi:hypothetical protein
MCSVSDVQNHTMHTVTKNAWCVFAGCEFNDHGHTTLVLLRNSTRILDAGCSHDTQKGNHLHIFRLL